MSIKAVAVFGLRHDQTITNFFIKPKVLPIREYEGIATVVGWIKIVWKVFSFLCWLSRAGNFLQHACYFNKVRKDAEINFNNWFFFVLFVCIFQRLCSFEFLKFLKTPSVLCIPQKQIFSWFPFIMFFYLRAQTISNNNTAAGKTFGASTIIINFPSPSHVCAHLLKRSKTFLH